ncbi:unnamed protein product [Oreochromis niloticus]|nr:unnamed protein product [Mustela putorius furo]
MSKKHELTSESKPCIQEAGGGIPLVQTIKILETKNIENIHSTNILNEFEQRHKTIDPSSFKIAIDSLRKKYTTTGKDDHKEKDTSSDPKNHINHINQKKMKKYQDIMGEELVTGVENVYFKTLWEYIENSNDKCRQSAFAIICMEDNTVEIFEEVRPYIPTKKCRRTNHNTNPIHSEQAVLKNIHKRIMDTSLAQNNKKVKLIFLNSYYSPCLERDDQIEGCMFLILRKASKWFKEHGVITVLTYTIPWGLCGPGYFNQLSSKDIMNPKSPFKSCVEEYENIPYKLDYKSLDKILDKHGILKQLSCGEDNERIKVARKALVKLAEGSTALRKDFLELGDKEIDSFIFLSENIKSILKKLWRENVNYSFVSLVKENITTIFNQKGVHLFTQDLESQSEISRFIQLHQLPPVKIKR